MKILGFDTNKNFIAWALVEIENDKERILDYNTIHDNELYFHDLTELIKNNDVIACEDFRFYSNHKINDDSIQSIKRIGHIQMICNYTHKLLWEFTRPVVLLKLFGSGKLKKGPANRLFSVRLGSDIKRIPQHNKDAAMVGVHAYYHIIYQQSIPEEVV